MSIDFLFPKMVELANRMNWEGKEVIRDINGQPQLFERIKLTGPVFHHRAMEPFVRIGNVMAAIVEIDDDGLEVRAYFDCILPDNQAIEFGYDGEGVFYRFSRYYSPSLISRLDRKIFAKEVRLLKEPGQSSVTGIPIK